MMPCLQVSAFEGDFAGWRLKVTDVQCAVQGWALHTRPTATVTRPSHEA
jgi:hypothetical protein